jgi:cytochrome c553
MRVSFIILLIALTACAPAADSAKNLPAGDATSGAQLFTQSINGVPSCSSCHSLDDSVIAGPGMQGYAARAGTRIPNMSAQDYTYQSIVQPGAYIVPGFANVMYDQYGQRLSPQQIADLVAFLLTR